MYFAWIRSYYASILLFVLPSYFSKNYASKIDASLTLTYNVDIQMYKMCCSLKNVLGAMISITHFYYICHLDLTTPLSKKTRAQNY